MKFLSIYEMSLLVKVFKFDSFLKCLEYFNYSYEFEFDPKELLTVYNEYK